MKKFAHKFTFIIVCLVLASCSRHIDSNVYNSSDSAGIVVKGVILSSRDVIVKDSDRLQDNAIGGAAGGIAGGVAGSSIGSGSGQDLATVGGAIGGAIAGAVIQDELSTSAGIEYIVELLDQKPTRGKDYREETELVFDRDSIKEKLNASVNTPNSESNIISTVQGTDVRLQPGQKVYVIYNTGRIRLVAASH